MLNVGAGATFNASNDSTINGGPLQTVNISGTFNKTKLTSTGTTRIGAQTNIMPGGVINLISGNLATTSLNNVGTIKLGSQTVLNVTGTYTQSSTGTLNVAVGGGPTTGLFGQLLRHRDSGAGRQRHH